MSFGFQQSQEQVHIPSGGDFLPTGFIAAWHGKVVFSFYAETRLEDESAFKIESQRPQGSGVRYYFTDPVEAKRASEAAGLDFAPSQVWRFVAGRDTVLNVADKEKLSKFSDPIVFEVAVKTLRAKKERHALHMISLPLAVLACAKALKYDNAGFELPQELTAFGENAEKIQWNDELQARLIGTEKDYESSDLWQKRAELWKSLGEPEPHAYQIAGDKFVTAAPKLRDCLSILHSVWPQAEWLRLIQVTDPRVDATYGDDNKRLSIPAIAELFATKQEAEAAAKKDIERMSKDKSNGNGHKLELSIPKDWQDAGEEGVKAWHENVAIIKAALEGKSGVSRAKFIGEKAKELSVTTDELMKWIN